MLTRLTLWLSVGVPAPTATGFMPIAVGRGFQTAFGHYDNRSEETIVRVSDNGEVAEASLCL